MKNKTKGTIQDKKSRFFWRFMPMLYHKAIMIKKAAAQFLLLFVMLGTASAASAAGGVAAGLSPERAYGKAGDEITIFLRFNNQSGRDIFAMDFRLSFDASVLRHRDTVLTTQNKDHWDFSYGPGPNYVHAGYDETTVSYPIKASETEIAAITFEAVKNGKSDVSVVGLALYDQAGTAIPAGGGRVTVTVGAAAGGPTQSAGSVSGTAARPGESTGNPSPPGGGGAAGEGTAAVEGGSASQQESSAGDTTSPSQGGAGDTEAGRERQDAGNAGSVWWSLAMAGGIVMLAVAGIWIWNGRRDKKNNFPGGKASGG